MKERNHIEVLSHRLKVRGIADDTGSEAVTKAHLAGSGFTSRPIGDRYSPTIRIGRGRLGEIYEAHDAVGRDLGVERRVALQRIDDRIVAEQQLVAELESGYALLRAGSHPNVVKTVDFFRDGRSYYVVMELLDGVSLRSVLDEAAPEALSLEESASVVRAVGDGLQYLHAKSIVHGDVRPSNVFITLDYTVKLLDVAPLSPPSRAPYRVEDGERGSRTRDVRDDVYDIACLTYELLSGRHPFNASSPYDAERAGLKVAPLPHLTVRQWEAVARGLALQRAQRTPSVAQFLSEFGISGTERLRAPHDRAAAPRQEPRAVPLAPVASASFTAPPVARVVEAPSRAPETLRATHVEFEPHRRDSRESSFPFRGLALFLLLVGIGALAFMNYDALKGAFERVANPAAGTATLPATPTAPAEREPASEAGAPSDEAAPASTAAAPPDPVEPNAIQAAEPLPPPAQLPVEIVEPNVVVPLEDAPAQPASRQRSAQPGPSSSSPTFRFAQSVVTIGEGQTAAAVTIERSGVNTPATIVWWTSGDTALADEDFADLGQRTERFAAGESTRTVYVPLVADSLPERTETFYVYVGRFEAGRTNIQQLANMRVNIRDDD